jgi:hypothetical protein
LGGLTPSTATTGVVTLAGTLNTTSGGTGLTSYTAGDLSYYASGTALTKLAIGTSGYLLTSSGTAPQWSNSISIGAGTFTSITDSGLTSGRVTYATTGGLLTDSANLLYSGTDLTVYGITVGRGAGAVSTNTAVGASALGANVSGTANTAIGANSLQNNTGSNNTSVGRFAMQTNVGGGGNTAVGSAALTTNSAGDGNTAIGQQALQANTASNNTAVGYQAGYSTTAASNTFLGWSAGYFNSTGTSNIAVGYGAYAQSGTLATGNNNIAIGDNSLRSIQSGANNTAVGHQAGYLNAVISNQTFVGYQAGYSRTANNDNYSTVMVGFQAGYSTVSGIDNTYVGGYAGKFQTGSTNTALGGGALYGSSGLSTGIANVAIGYAASQNNQSGSYNVSVGHSANVSNTGSSGCVAVGYQALFLNTGGSSCTAIGTQALAKSTVSNYNVAVGHSAMTNWNNTGSDGSGVAVGYQAAVNMTTALRTTAIGYQAMLNATTAGFNTAVGSGAMVGLSGTITGTDNIAIGSWHDGVIEGPMAYLSTGSENVAVGQASMKGGGVGLLTGSYNAAFGNRSLGSITSGINNTAIGYNAGYNITSGHENVFVGRNAGFTNAGNANTFIGAYAGNVSTGSSNTFIGSGLAGSIYASGERMTTGNKNTIVGNFSGIVSGMDISTASNYVVLSDGDGNPRVITNTDGSTFGAKSVGSGFAGLTGYSFNAMLSKQGTASGAKQAVTFTIKYFQGNNGWETGNLLIYVSSSKLDASNNSGAWYYYTALHYDTAWSLTLKDSGGDTSGSFSITNTSPAGGYNTQKTVTVTITTVPNTDTMAAQIFYSDYQGVYSIT